MPSAQAKELGPAQADEASAVEYDFDAMEFDVSFAKDALEDHLFIDEAFYWNESPQGGEFWEKQFDYGLDEEGRDALQDMIDAYERAHAS